MLRQTSTYIQARLDFRSDEPELAAEPPGFAVHVLLIELAGQLLWVQEALEDSVA